MAIFSRFRESIDEKLKRLWDKYPREFVDEKLKEVQGRVVETKRTIDDKLADVSDKINRASDFANRTFEQTPGVRAVRERSIEPLVESFERGTGLNEIELNEEQIALDKRINELETLRTNKQKDKPFLTKLAEFTNIKNNSNFKDINKAMEELEALKREAGGDEYKKLLAERELKRMDFVMGAIEPLAGVRRKVAKKTSEPVASYIKSQISKRKELKKAPSKMISFLKESKSKLIDFAAPIEDAINQAQKKFKFQVLPEKDITNQIDRVLRSPSIGVQFMKDNGLEKVIQGVDNLDEFDQYLIARHAKDLEAFGIKTGRSTKQDTQLLKELAPKFEEQAKKVTKYSQDLLDYISDAGLIAKETAEALKTKYPNYIPFNRVFEELEKVDNLGTGGGVASLSGQSVVKKIVGSGREVESPLESLLSKTNDAFTQGEKNKTAQLLSEYRKLPGFEDLIKEGEGTHTFSYLDNGVKRTFETTKEMAAAAKSLNVQQLGLLGRILAVPTRVAKVGITGINLPFVAANIVRDIMFSATTSKATSKSLLSLPKSLFQAVKHGDIFDDMVKQGALSTSFDIAREQVPTTLKKIRAGKNIPSKILYTVTRPKELFRAVEDIVGRSEEVSRISQFEGAKSQALSKGMSEARANIVASRAARENSVNFMRRGEWGSVLNSAFLYLQAGIQGIRTWGRALKERPLETGTKFVATFALPISAATAWNLNDPERRKVYEDISESEKENSIIIVPNNAKKGENGRWGVIKIPLTPGVGDAAQIFRHAIESIKDYDQVTFEDIYKSVVGSVSPLGSSKEEAISTAVPQAIKPTVEAITNRNLFFGSDQVPQSKQGLPNELQVKKSTTGTAKVIGKKLDVSPIKVDEFLKGTFGSIVPQIQRQTDKLLAKAGIIDEGDVKGISVAEAISKRFTSAYGNAIERKQIDGLSQLLDKEKEVSHLRRLEAEKFVEGLEGKTKEEKLEMIKKIASEDKLLFEKTVDVITDNKLGITYSDRLIKQLNVQDGGRAKYIVQEMNKLETKQEQKEYLLDLTRKKIVSEAVLQQIMFLIKKQGQ